MKIYLTAKAHQQLSKIPQKMYEVIIEKIEKLRIDPLPTSSKKLINRQGWRIRAGDYRILYTIDSKKKELTILSVAHRKEAYR